MTQDNSRNPIRVRDSSLLLLVKESASGHLDNLDCPSCRRASVSVSFSCPAPEIYRTWFVCADCDFRTRVQNTTKPIFFSEDRVSEELEEKDKSILRRAIFKRPPQRLM
jgi:hypothetical protein